MSKRILALLVFAAAWLTATPGAAQPACNLTGEHLMSWPDVNPVWQFCWLRPQDSSGTRGSALEIRNVYFNGHLVMKRGHVPMLNVDYDPGGCGCYRDWQYQEVVFHANNPISPGYAEPTVPPLTVCDTGGSAGDCGPPDTDCFTGVAAEKLSDRLILTTQMEAGWYRYSTKWRFYLDGRIEPFFGFAAIDAPCVYHSHRHHAYWRLDFDIDDAGNDVVTEGPNPAAPGGNGRPGPKPPIVVLPTEAMRVNNRPGLTWSVVDSGTHRGYRIVPGSETALAADSFSVGDFWALKYKANELDDGGNIGDCPVDFSTFLNGESIAGDVVVWYRTGWYHPSNSLDDCDIGGPTLVPIGDWGPSGGPR